MDRCARQSQRVSELAKTDEELVGCNGALEISCSRASHRFFFEILKWIWLRAEGGMRYIELGY